PVPFGLPPSVELSDRGTNPRTREEAKVTFAASTDSAASLGRSALPVPPVPPHDDCRSCAEGVDGMSDSLQGSILVDVETGDSGEFEASFLENVGHPVVLCHGP